MCNKEQTEKMVLYEHQFVPISSRMPTKKQIQDFPLLKYLKDYSSTIESSNNNCSHLNKFKGCNKNSFCSCVIITCTFKNIDYNLFSELKLRWIDSITL